MRAGRRGNLHATTHKHEKRPPRLHKLHRKAADKPARRKRSLRPGQKARCIWVAGRLRDPVGVVAADAALGHVVDEGACDGDLSAGVAELREGGVEEAVLLAEGLDIGAGVCDLGLEGHVGVCDFRDLYVLSVDMGTRWVFEAWTYRGEVEYYSQHVDEDRDGKVYPLHVLERLRALAHIDEENVGAEDGRNDRSNTIESLREVDAQLGVLWRTAHSNCHSLANALVTLM